MEPKAVVTMRCDEAYERLTEAEAQLHAYSEEHKYEVIGDREHELPDPRPVSPEFLRLSEAVGQAKRAYDECMKSGH